MLAASLPARATDAIAAFGDYYVRSSIIRKCHPARDPDIIAYLAQGDALQRAALEEFWSEFDAVNPTHHRENRIRAEEMLQQERAARDMAIDEQIRNYGCERLISAGHEKPAR